VEKRGPGGRPQKLTDDEVLADIDMPIRQAVKKSKMSRSRLQARRKMIRDRLSQPASAGQEGEAAHV